MPEPAIIPRPAHAIFPPGVLPPAESAQVTAPPAITGLLAEVLPGVGGSFQLIEDAELGPEGYRLRIDGSGVEALATTETGLRWAVSTLRQLAHPDGLPYAEITDVPRLPWRGALLDVARWCHPIEFVREFVDLLALHKLNTLHLHLTDDQGWRFEVHKYPRLTEVGAYRTESNSGHARDGKFDGTPHGGFYAQEQLRDLVAYAERRGVRIMPEIDLPGHMQAAISAYPWLGNDPERQLPVRTAWGISKHVLNTDDATLAFARDVLDEVVAVFPFEYVHLGGDEVPLDEWTASEAAQKRVANEGLGGTAELLGWWIKEMGDHLAGHGRKIAAWDELVEAAPPKDTLIFAWRGAERVSAALEAGHEVVAVPQEFVYLDHYETQSPDEPLAIGGHTPLDRVYGFEPVPTGAAGRVLGTQGMLWSEYTPTPSLVQFRAFPRLAAVAEVAWSADRDLSDFHQRLDAHLVRLEQRTITVNRLGLPH